MELQFSDLVIDKRAVKANAEDLISEWLWLIPSNSEPMLPTTCGDLFLRCADGSIAFLDTYAGSCNTVAPNYEQWKGMLNTGQHPEDWFKADLVNDLFENGIRPQPGQCLSPYVPQIIGGSWTPANFSACDLRVHLAMLGQVHRQVKDLPPGTKITGFKIVE